MSPSRIVSLLPSATEILCALGLRDRLVGVSHECDYPLGVADLPHITSSILDHNLSVSEIDAAVAEASLERRPIYAVDGDLLINLAPDLIVTQGVCAVCAVTEETVAQGLRFATVEATCSAEVLSLLGVDLAGVRRDILAVGAAAGVEARAKALVSKMESTWDALPGLNETGPSVLMLEWPDPPWFGGHWVPEQVQAAGGRDAFCAAGENSGRIDWERVHEADPDVIVVMACGLGLAENLKQAQNVLGDPAHSSLRAVRTGEVWAADANAFFSRPGPRIVDGATLLSRIFAGKPVPEHEAVKVFS